MKHVDNERDAMTRLRIGLLGAARITPKAIMAPARNMDDVEVVAVAARDTAKAEAFAREHDVPTTYPDYETLITAPDIDLIYNALPVSGHAPWSIAALKAGKHVLCEKPFAMTLTEAKSVLDTAQANQRRIVEAFHHHYHPAFQTCLGWVRDGRIGDVTHIDTNFSVHIPDKNGEIRHSPDLGGGAMFDLGCYPLTWILTVINASPISVEAKAILTPTGVDETLKAELGFAGGATAHIHTSMADGAPRQSHLKITGTHGEIWFNNPVFPPNGGELVLTTKSGTEVHDVDPTPTYDFQLRAVVDALRYETNLPTAGDAILRQQTTLDSIHKAAGRGKG